jgi:hypothetical protein
MKKVAILHKGDCQIPAHIRKKALSSNFLTPISRFLAALHSIRMQIRDLV